MRWILHYIVEAKQGSTEELELTHEPSQAILAASVVALLQTFGLMRKTDCKKVDDEDVE